MPYTRTSKKCVLSRNMLSIDQISTLLRLYLDWPDKIGDNTGQQANEFYLWLSEVAQDQEDLDEIGAGGVPGLLAEAGRQGAR